MLELRIVEESKLIPTANEKCVPSLVGADHELLSNVILTEVCYNDKGSFLQWKRNLFAEDISIAIYNKRGRLETLYVNGHRVVDESIILEYLKKLTRNKITVFEGKTGKTIILFYTPERKNNGYQRRTGRVDGKADPA